jgi:hypothetical protein
MDTDQHGWNGDGSSRKGAKGAKNGNSGIHWNGNGGSRKGAKNDETGCGAAGPRYDGQG